MHPGSVWPPPCCVEGTVFLADGEASHEARHMEGDIYVDGACYPSPVPDMCRAGWAVVQRPGPGLACKVLYGPVWPPLPQTSQCAEWVAWAVAHQVATAPAVVHSDCSSVTNAHGAPLQVSLRHRSLYAGIVRSTLNDPGRACIPSCVKVKAHLTLQEGMPAQLVDHIVNNERADRFAKLGAMAHPQPPQEVVDSWQRDLSDLDSFASLLVAVWPLWPKPIKAGRLPAGPVGRRGRRPSAVSNPNATRHQWVYGLGRWQCSACNLVKVNARSKARASVRVCPAGGRPILFRLASSGLGHNLMVQQCDTLPLVFCTTCGKWGTMKMSGLLKQCTGSQSEAATAALRRLASGRHPSLPLVVGPAGRLLPDGTVQEAVMTPAQLRMAALRARVMAR